MTVNTGANAVTSEAITITDNTNLTLGVGTAGFGQLSLNLGGSTGTVGVTDNTALTLTNLVQTTGSTSAITISTSSGNLTLGSGIALAGLTSTTSLTASAGIVTDTASSPVYIAGNVTVVGNKGIAINNNTANSLGELFLTATTGSLLYTEGQTVNLGSVTVSGTSGSLAISSINGNIIQTGGGLVTVTNSGYTASFSAPAGVVQLTNANTINKADAIALTAGGATALGTDTINNNAATGTLLGNVSDTLQPFTVTSTGGSISQASGTSIFEYGIGSFTTGGTGTITLTNSGNNFGHLILTTNRLRSLGHRSWHEQLHHSHDRHRGNLPRLSNANIVEMRSSAQSSILAARASRPRLAASPKRQRQQFRRSADSAGGLGQRGSHRRQRHRHDPGRPNQRTSVT